MVFSCVERCDEVDLLEKEQFHIDALRPWCNISDARGSHVHDDAAKEKMRQYALNRTPEHRALIEECNSARRGVPNGRAGIPTGRVPSTSFKQGQAAWNKKYTAEELVQKRREWNRENARIYRARHAEELREYKRLKAREYRARKKLLEGEGEKATKGD